MLILLYKISTFKVILAAWHNYKEILSRSVNHVNVMCISCSVSFKMLVHTSEVKWIKLSTCIVQWPFSNILSGICCKLASLNYSVCVCLCCVCVCVCVCVLSHCVSAEMEDNATQSMLMSWSCVQLCWCGQHETDLGHEVTRHDDTWSQISSCNVLYACVWFVLQTSLTCNSQAEITKASTVDVTSGQVASASLFADNVYGNCCSCRQS